MLWTISLLLERLREYTDALEFVKTLQKRVIGKSRQLVALWWRIWAWNGKISIITCYMCLQKGTDWSLQHIYDLLLLINLYIKSTVNSHCGCMNWSHTSVAYTELTFSPWSKSYIWGYEYHLFFYLVLIILLINSNILSSFFNFFSTTLVLSLSYVCIFLYHILFPFI